MTKFRFSFQISLFYILCISSSIAQTQRIYIPEQGYIIYDAYMFSVNEGISIGSYGTVLSTADTFRTWKRYPTETKHHLYGITFFDDKNTGIIVGAKGTIFRTQDKGNTWQSINSNVTDTLYDVIPINNTDIIAIGQNGRIIKSQDKGSTWITIETGIEKTLRSISISPKGDLLAVGANGTIIISENGGEAWQQRSVTIKEQLYSCAWANNDICMVGGEMLKLLRSENKGATWDSLPRLLELVDVDFVDHIYSIKFINNTYGVLCGNLLAAFKPSQCVFETKDAGKTWLPTHRDVSWKNPGLGSVMYSIFSLNEDTIFSFGYTSDYIGPFVFYTIDGTKKWQKSFGNTESPKEVHFAQNHVVNENSLIVATRKGDLMRTDNNGITWSKKNIMPNNPIMGFEFKYNWGLIGGDTGRVYRSIGDINTWENIDFLPDSVYRNWAYKPVIVNDSVAFVQFISYGPKTKREDQDIFMRTSDKGNTWQRITVAPNKHFEICKPFFVDKKNGFIAGDFIDSVTFYTKSSGFYKSIDEGVTWSEITPIKQLLPDSSRMANAGIYFFNENQGYVFVPQKITKSTADNDNPVLLYTSDGGQTWEKRNESLRFYGSLAVMDFYWKNLDEGYLLCNVFNGELYRTTDGGRTWNQLYKIREQYEANSFSDLSVQGDDIIISGSESTVLRFSPSFMTPVPEHDIQINHVNEQGLVFPNPAQDRIGIRVNAKADMDFQLFDMYGVLIKETLSVVAGSEDVLYFSVADIPSGNYTIQAKSGHNVTYYGFQVMR